MFKQISFITALAVLGGILPGCQRESANTPAASPPSPALAQPADARTYEVKGVVLEILPDGKSARIRHEAIPGYMDAMTMPFRVPDAKDLSGVKPADIVTFRLNVTEERGWIDHIKVVGQEEKVTTIPHVRLVRSVEPLETGDTLPDYPFTNQLGKVFRTADFKGSALAVTFIFTRCPFPDFCPKMTKGFAAAQKLLKADNGTPKNVHFLSLSFDPEHDTPATLLSYGKAYNIDFANWTLASGAILEIDDITERFGVEFTRDESGVNFNHKLRTVVLDTRGRVHHIFIGNTWEPSELVEKMVEAAKVPAEDSRQSK